jgi:predicted ATPase with chaperone activity
MVLCMSQFNLSARAYHRILKLARTIADLAGCEEIRSVHLAALTVCFAKALQAPQPPKSDDLTNHVL